jgi:hypothetical protein
LESHLEKRSVWLELVLLLPLIDWTRQWLQGLKIQVEVVEEKDLLMKSSWKTISSEIPETRELLQLRQSRLNIPSVEK